MPDADIVVKFLKEDALFPSFPLRNAWKICRSCFMFFLPTEPTEEDVRRNDEPVEQVCYRCLSGKLTAPFHRTAKKIKTKRCKYCFKRRKLIGVWCRPCKNHSNREEIKRLLKLPVRNYDEELALAFMKQTPVWRKEFL